MPLSPAQKKLLTYGVPVVVVLGVIALLRSRSSGSTSSTATGSGTVTAASSAPGQAVGLSDLANLQASVNTELGSIGAAVTTLQNTVNGLTSTPAGGTTAVAAPPNPTPFNPYPVGTIVAPGEKIVQTVPVGNAGYVDVTSLGGLYTTPGIPGVNGSAYNPAPPPPGFNYSAQVNGSTVYEATPTGVRTFQA